ncbi:DUF4197 domain-containing protein [Sphingomonas sp. ac-8]|uniref:DUF4197 domain-containing protein n=1 Tax=Sphingomonas sp. ac-8 TaxID=3242977 RepID=UPI003A8057E8
MTDCASPARRRLLVQSAALLPLVALAGCATPLGSYGVEEGVRRLLTLSSQRAFARLTEPGGFYDDQLTRLVLPETGGNDVLGAVLRTNAVRGRVAQALNDVAVDAADRATPVVLDSIRSLTLTDALAVLRGGPTAATDLLQRQVGGALVETMFPEFSAGLRSDTLEILTAIAGARTGIDYAALARTGAEQAGQAIFRAIGREEAAIRADPRSTRDPTLIALLSGASLVR